MVNKAEKYEDAAAITREFEEIVRTKKSNNFRIAYQQFRLFKRFKEKGRFIEMVKKFGFNKSTIIFKINVLKLIDKHLNR